jgi:RNA polymerase sigma factor (TIGR02999 family)
MLSADAGTVTQLLRRWRGGDEAAVQQLVPLVYDELRRLARLQMRGERREHTLQPTALVHEAYGRLVALELSWQDRSHFLSMAARVMRWVLVEHARARRAEKRGGGAVKVSLDAADRATQPHAVIELDEALERLSSQDERPARAIELHYFGGLSYVEIAEALGISEATVDRDMRFARAWLRRALEGGGAGS